MRNRSQTGCGIGCQRSLSLVFDAACRRSLLGTWLRLFQDPEIPVIANASADYVKHADDIRRALVKQFYSPVRWEETVQKLVAEGVDVFVEVGPGKVLSGLIKRISRSVTVISFQDMEGLEKVLEMV